MRTMKKILLLLLLGLFLAPMASGQLKMTIKLADKAFSDFSWNEAIDLYLYAHEKDPKNAYIIRRLADSYRQIGNTEEVEKWLTMLIDMNEHVPSDLFHYSMALKSNGKYHQSEEALAEYATMNPEDGRINLEQSLLDYIDFLVKDSSRYEVSPVPFNTKGSDWGATVFENKVVFVSTGDPSESREKKYNWDQLPFLDMYYVTVDEYGNYSKSDIFAPKLKTANHDGPASFDVTSKRMYFNSNRDDKEIPSKSSDENNLQIFYADYVNNDWELKGGFKYNNPLYSLRHPSVDKTGNVLYFASDMPGGKGGNDIYFCRKVNGEWSSPINLEEINTEGEEMFPFIADDGVLYFSSNGQGGMGGLDIYMALPDRGVFTKVENMGFPVNSSRDDFGMVLDGEGMKGYFASNRPGGLGFDDIYKLEILWIPVQIMGTVRDRINGFEVAGATVELYDENGELLETAISKEDGEFQFGAFKQRNYRLTASKEGFIPSEKDVSTFNKLPNEKIEVDMFIELDFSSMEEPDQLEPLSLEMLNGEHVQIIQIEHINYGYDSDKILPEAAIILNKLAEMLSQYPDLQLIVESHTDSKGSDEYNLKLSKRRASSAYNYLLKRGVKSEAIEYSGYGETMLLNHCDDSEECSEEEHAINRRSIIKVIRRGTYQQKRNTRSMFYF